MQKYRKLSAAEIAELESRNCFSDNWEEIQVDKSFLPKQLRNCTLCGKIYIGANVRISNIGSHIANYILEDDVRIENVDRIETIGRSRFGNGTEAAVINEHGGREVPLFDMLTAQTAYVIALYRHRRQTIEKMNALIGTYCLSREAELGRVGTGATITDSGIIRNVNIGSGTSVCGASILSNGTIVATPEQPVFVGAGVKMYDFIVRGKSTIDDDTILKRCFVGQGVTLANFSASDSLFFANAHCENGEACSIFAGPYTVSHHKSSLLIAGMFSFFNAGSGSNQSNHLFKTGAVHQGIHQRGCKFGSDAYMMLPIRNGAFSVVIGRHKNHPDTENFPFSYLMEDSGVSYLVPGINLGSYGTVRDIDKWPRRDKRGEGAKADLINFEEANPFVCERVMRAIGILEDLSHKEGVEVYSYERMKIKASMLRRGLKLYRQAFDKFIGRMLADGGTKGFNGTGHWIDAAGMFLPAREMTRLLDDIDAGTLASLEQIDKRFRTIRTHYTDFAYDWAYKTLSAALGHEATDDEVAQAITRGNEAAAHLKQMTDDDYKKDCDLSMAIGYGIDAQSREEIEEDYRTVRNL